MRLPPLVLALCALAPAPAGEAPSPEEAGRLLDAERKTVGWDFQFRLDTPHLRIYSSQTPPFTRRLADLLEKETDVYRRFYGEVWVLEKNPPPITVFLFGDRETFGKVLKPLIGPASERVEGLYFIRTRILYIGTSVAGEKAGSGAYTLLRNAAHEMLHALDDQWAHQLKPLPEWLKEGRAEHFAFGVQGREVQPGTLHLPKGHSLPAGVRRALAGVSIRDVVGMDKAAFLGRNAPCHYILSWAFIQFLHHGESGKHAKGFREFLKAGKLTAGDLEAAVAPFEILEPAFKVYVGKELLPALEAAPTFAD